MVMYYDTRTDVHLHMQTRTQKKSISIIIVILIVVKIRRINDSTIINLVHITTIGIKLSLLKYKVNYKTN